MNILFLLKNIKCNICIFYYSVLFDFEQSKECIDYNRYTRFFIFFYFNIPNLNHLTYFLNC